MPRQIEGFGLVPLESLACGRPVVAVPTGGMEWLVGHLGCIIVASRETGPIKQAIVRVLEHQSSFAAVIRASRRVLRRRFDVRACARRYVSIYQRLLRFGPPGCELKTAGKSAVRTGRNSQFGRNSELPHASPRSVD
jgi:glycosyltransferase involved in cell wall biosynthesis